MIDESQIPLLEDLISRGQMDSDQDNPPLSADDHLDMQIEQEETLDESDDAQDAPMELKKDELADDASLQELIIDEEIRMILDKHMDRAYE